jgi:hypothetical protein
MSLSRQQNAGQDHNVNVANRSFQKATQFYYLESTVTNHNFIQEEIKRRLNSGNDCKHSAQSLFSPCLLSIIIYKPIILPVILHGCVTWSLTLRQQHRLGVSEENISDGMVGKSA